MSSPDPKAAVARAQFNDLGPKGAGRRHPSLRERWEVLRSLLQLKVNLYEARAVSLQIGGLPRVEDRGLEPLTSCMPCKRSPS